MSYYSVKVSKTEVYEKEIVVYADSIGEAKARVKWGMELPGEEDLFQHVRPETTISIGFVERCYTEGHGDEMPEPNTTISMGAEETEPADLKQWEVIDRRGIKWLKL